jgi:Ca2+-binding RTX toxin-like protein
LSANIRWDSVNGVISIFGLAGSDLAVVELIGSATLRATLNAVEAEQFPLSSVRRIDFFGGLGDDVFNNRTGAPSRAFGDGGNDRLYGGTSSNTLAGGAGHDWLFGGSGPDALYGGLGNDQIWGGAAADQLHGEDGDDALNGQAGDDFLWGLAGNDALQGEDGRDTLRGGDGADRLFGGGQADLLYGESGADLVHGDADNDIVYGGNHDDQVNGGPGDDWVYGDYGNDQLFGGQGHDVVEGFMGNDVLRGDDGNDILRGQADGDVIHGDGGNDQILGGDGDDQLFGWAGNDGISGGSGWDRLMGGAGNDSLAGDDGNDRLYGENDADVLSGGNGDDWLFGGAPFVVDLLYGHAGRDRFILERSDVASDASGVDAVLMFSAGNAAWNAVEIEVIDRGLQRLFGLTNNNSLLRDPLDRSGVELVKYTALAGGSISRNRLSSHTTNAGTTYTRTIEFADWNENEPRANDVIASTVVHEFAHNWDSAKEISAVRPAVQGIWSNFLARSGWTQSQPANLSLYYRSSDGAWWYLRSAEFARDYGRANPFEDWATVWERYAFPTAQPMGTNLQAKVSTLTALLADLAKLS